jgi:hypothetical protein
MNVIEGRFDRRVQRVLARTTKTDSCWLWSGGASGGGYGRVRYGKTHQLQAHRVIYEAMVGPIPEGMQIDHLCRVRHCVNPDHLEAVTAAENNRRSNSPTACNARKTHCPQGHPYDEQNTDLRPDGGRRCRACSRVHALRYYHAKKGRKEVAA